MEEAELMRLNKLLVTLKVWHFILSQGAFSMEKTEAHLQEKKKKAFFFLKSVCRKKCQLDNCTSRNDHSYKQLIQC